MIGMKFTGQLLLFQLLYCLTSTAKVTITCDAPRVTAGQPATVTCDFKRNVSALSSATVTVEHYPDGSANPTPVLECTPVGADCKLPVPGYEFNGQINTKLVLTITSASKENSGRFACKMLSPGLPETDEVDPCVFIVDDESTSSTKPPPYTTKPPGPPSVEIDIALIAGPIGAGIVIAAVAIIIICIIKKRRKDQTQEKLLEQSALTPQKKHTDGEKGPPTEVTPKRKALTPPNKGSSPQTQASEERQDDESEPQDSPSDRLLDTSQQETAENGDHLTPESIPTQQNEVVDDPTSAENGDSTPQGTPKQQKEVGDDPTSHTDDDESGAQAGGFNEASELVPENKGSQEEMNSAEKEDPEGEEPEPGNVKKKANVYEQMQDL